MIHQAAKETTRFLVQKKILEPENADIYTYVAESVFSTALNVIFCFFISLALGLLLQGMVFMLAFVLLRRTAGGFHASTHARCIAAFCVVSTAALCVVKFVPMDILTLALPVLGLVATVVIFIFAPVEHKNNPLAPAQKIKLRRKSRVLICIIITVGIVGLSLTGQTMFCAMLLGIVSVGAGCGLAVWTAKRQI